MSNSSLLAPGEVFEFALINEKGDRFRVFHAACKPATGANATQTDRVFHLGESIGQRPARSIVWRGALQAKSKKECEKNVFFVQFC